MKEVSLLIKPASSRCNMRCRYCFYGDLAGKRDEGDFGVMSYDTAEAVVRAAMESAEPGGAVRFVFQGGEPTLAGLPFYRDFVALARRRRRPGVAVSYAIQTNGLLVDTEWAEFFAQNHFLVGLSIDGDRDLHDLHRPDAGGKGTWLRTAGSLRLMQSRGVEVNLLCVVTRQCARSARRTYQALVGLGATCLQFIPCLDPLDQPRGGESFSLTPKEYGRFLCALFDAWYLDWKQGKYVSIRLFDDYVHLAMGLSAGACSAAGGCGAYLVVEADGGLYPCDFYVLDQWRLGRVGTLTLEEAQAGALAARFRAEGRWKSAACEDCRWLSLCHGGCRRDRIGPGHQTENYFCPAFRQFFSYAEDRLRQIASAELRLLSVSRRSQEGAAVRRK